MNPLHFIECSPWHATFQGYQNIIVCTAHLQWVCLIRHFVIQCAGACPVGGSGGLSTPPKVWHNSQLSSYVTTIVTNKQQLVAKTTHWTRSQRQFLIATRQNSLLCCQVVFKNALMRGVVKKFCAHVFSSASPFLKSWTRPCILCYHGDRTIEW